MNENLLQNNNPKMKPIEPKYINQNDFIYFKNELLKDLKEIESKINDKVKTTLEKNEEKILSIDTKINLCREKILELSSIINSDKSQSENINKLIIFKSKTEDKISLYDKKIKELKDYLNESIYSMNKSINENINYPGIIGINSKFPNFHAYIDFVISNINNLNSFKEKMVALDIKNYKNNLDKIMKSYKIQIDSFMNSTKNLNTENLLVCDNKISDLFKLFENKLDEEKNLLKQNIEEISEKYNKMNINMENIKNEFNDKIGKNKDENEKNFEKLNLLNEKYLNDIDILNKKIEENNENIKQINNQIDEKMKSQEEKLLSKNNHLFSLIKKHKINPYLKLLNKDNINDKEFNNMSSLDLNISTKINKILDIDEISCINNKKIIKFHKKSNKNNQENIDDKLFMNRKKLDSYIIEKENTIINQIPRKQIIKDLLQSASRHISIYNKQNKKEKKIFINKIKTNPKLTLSARSKLDINDSIKKKFIKSLSQFYPKKKSEEGNSINNTYIFEDLPKIDKNKRTFSSRGKTRNNEDNSMRKNSIKGFNTTDILKDNNNNFKIKENDDDKENNLNILNNKIFNNINENKEDEYQKKKNKIINKFNSASNLFDINVKNENLTKQKYKLLNILNKNIKTKESQTNKESKINQEYKLKNNKEKEKIKRPVIHYYFSVKNKNT